MKRKIIAVICIFALLLISSCHRQDNDDVAVLLPKEQPKISDTPVIEPEEQRPEKTEPEKEETPLPHEQNEPEIPHSEPQLPEFVDVPVLMYHHLSESGDGPYTISTQNFGAHLDALKANGYNTITPSQLLTYVENGEDLPQNPIVISFDDGYLSNYEIAYPMLKEREMNAVIFVIGNTIGAVGDDTRSRITYEQAAEMAENGIEIQSHTYDMHRAPVTDSDPTRKGVSKLEGETDEEHLKALNEDFALSVSSLQENMGQAVFALSYPYGIYNNNSETAATNNGIKMTFTSVPGISIIEKNNADSLRLIKRYEIDDCTAEELLQRIKNDLERGHFYLINFKSHDDTLYRHNFFQIYKLFLRFFQNTRHLQDYYPLKPL